MDKEAAAGTPVPARSLGELRERHVALLGLWRGALEDREKAERAAALRDAAAALGTWLEDDEERFTAQGVLDYWTAAQEGLSGQQLPEAAALKPFDPAAAESRAEAAEALLDAQDSRSIDAAETIFLRLLRVDQAGNIVECPPVPRAELAGAAGTPGLAVAGLVEALAAADVLRVRPGPSADEEAVEFASRGVARRWKRAAAALKEHKRIDTMRDRLRATALLWRQKDRQPGYLLGGGSLEEAKQFLGELDDNDALKEFLDASIAKGRRERFRFLVAMALGPALMVGVVWMIGQMSYWTGSKHGTDRGTEIGKGIGEKTGEDRGRLEAAERAPDTASLPAPPLEPTDPLGPTGYIWIGSAEEPMLQFAGSTAAVPPDSARAGQTYRVKSRVHMSLRTGLPSGEDPAPLLGVAPSNSLMVARDNPRGFDRPSGRQYWLRVRIVPRIDVWYSGEASQDRVRRLVQALRQAGFDPRPRPVRHDGPASVHFFHDQDRQIAAAVGRIAAANLRTPGGAPSPVLCELQEDNPQRLLPTVLHLRVNLSRPGPVPRDRSKYLCQ